MPGAALPGRYITPRSSTEVSLSRILGRARTATATAASSSASAQGGSEMSNARYSCIHTFDINTCPGNLGVLPQVPLMLSRDIPEYYNSTEVGEPVRGSSTARYMR